ncbi:lipase 1 isoform X1 [Jatropha curcas]|uniref:lipase 1 isoform X1 n=1 Tax=Jatropha curcas TaxID=180498 RepID=UPI0009D6508D|nr:lipase 1 isoform X1 [Jatropha curcas]
MNLIHPIHHCIFLSGILRSLTNLILRANSSSVIMTSSKLLHAFIFYLSTTLAILRFSIDGFFKLNRASILFNLVDIIFSIYYRLCGLTSFTVDLDDQTTVHFWTSNYRRIDRPNLVMIHGYGGDARWQFLYHVGFLSRKFNLYMPDLVFFGKSYSNRADRTDAFQARCLLQGLKGLGLERFSVYSISYGGYVAYRMAEMCGKEMEKLVIVSTGIGWSDDEKREHIRKIGRDPKDLLVPTNPHDLRTLVELSMYKGKPLRWLPDFFLQEFINVMGNNHRKEKLELVEHLLAKKADTNPPVLTQETLLIWGDQDKVFPVSLAHQLQRHLGPKSRVEIIKDAGHAVNMESPDAVNSLLTSFLLGHS